MFRSLAMIHGALVQVRQIILHGRSGWLATPNAGKETKLYCGGMLNISEFQGAFLFLVATVLNSLGELQL